VTIFKTFCETAIVFLT